MIGYPPLQLVCLSLLIFLFGFITRVSAFVFVLLTLFPKSQISLIYSPSCFCLLSINSDHIWKWNFKFFEDSSTISASLALAIKELVMLPPFSCVFYFNFVICTSVEKCIFVLFEDYLVKSLPLSAWDAVVLIERQTKPLQQQHHQSNRYVWVIKIN